MRRILVWALLAGSIFGALPTSAAATSATAAYLAPLQEARSTSGANAAYFAPLEQARSTSAGTDELFGKGITRASKASRTHEADVAPSTALAIGAPLLLVAAGAGLGRGRRRLNGRR